MLLTKAARCSRNILSHVNHAVKDCENHHKLVNLQKRLDTKQIQNSQNPLVADYKVCGNLCYSPSYNLLLLKPHTGVGLVCDVL